MSKRSLKKSQETVDTLAGETWSFLTEHFGPLRIQRPRVYLFLSPESKGSLKGRTKEEIEFVHDIQANAGGLILKRPPLLAYVSKPEQAVEETAHLYALLRQKFPVPLKASRSHEKCYSQLHEAFGEFVQCLVLPHSKRRPPKTTGSLWDQVHAVGYRLGRELAQALYDDQIRLSDVRAWVNLDWHRENQCQKALFRLKRLCAKRLRQSR